MKISPGLLSEKKHSQTFHQEGIPMLICANFLRSRNLGQLDLVRLKKDRGEWIIDVGEVKSSQMGEEAILRGQQRRIFEAQKYLASLLGYKTKFTRIVG